MADSVESNATEKSTLDNQQFRLNKINEIRDYFIVEIKERELMSKRLLSATVVAVLWHHLQLLLEHL